MSPVLLSQLGSLFVLLCVAATAWRLRGDATHGRRLTRMSWTLVAHYFAIIGATAFVQAVWSVWAYAAGPGSRAWTLFLEWSGGGNHGRALATTVFAAALIIQASRPGLIRTRPGAVPLLMVAAFCGGLLMGHLEGPVRATHFANLSVIVSLNVLLLMVALVLAVAADSMDLHLWFAMLVYTFEQALATAWFVDIARAVLTGRGAEMLHATTMSGYAIILGILLRRLNLAREGRFVPTLFERYHELSRT